MGQVVMSQTLRQSAGLIVITVIALLALGVAGYATSNANQAHQDVRDACVGAIKSRNNLNGNVYQNMRGWAIAAAARLATWQRTQAKEDLTAALGYAQVVRSLAYLPRPDCVKERPELASLWKPPPSRPTLPNALK